MSILRAFADASRYDTYADAQLRVAQALAARISELPLRADAQILEIGCGTGFLGDALIARLPSAKWTMTDLAPEMVSRAKGRLQQRADIQYAVMDGERPDQSGPFDLICSSLAFQWFENLPAAVERLRSLLAEDGWLAFTTLTEGCFSEWREAHDGESCGVPHYPAPHALRAMGLNVSIDVLPIRFGCALEFLQHLKGVGAHIPRTGYVPLAPKNFRKVMRNFESRGATATYRVATCIVQGLPDAAR